MRFWRHLTGAIAGVSAGALYGWSALAAPLQQAYQVRAAEVGQVFSFALLSFTLAVVVAPMLRRRLGTSTALAISAATAGLFTALAAFAPNFTVFVALFSVGFGGTSGLIYSTTIDMAARSSTPRIATPVFVALFGLGGVIFGPLWKVLVVADWGLKGCCHCLACCCSPASLGGAPGALERAHRVMGRQQSSATRPSMSSAMTPA